MQLERDHFMGTMRSEIGDIASLGDICLYNKSPMGYLPMGLGDFINLSESRPHRPPQKRQPIYGISLYELLSFQ